MTEVCQDLLVSVQHRLLSRYGRDLEVCNAQCMLLRGGMESFSRGSSSDAG